MSARRSSADTSEGRVLSRVRTGAWRARGWLRPAVSRSVSRSVSRERGEKSRTGSRGRPKPLVNGRDTPRDEKPDSERPRPFFSVATALVRRRPPLLAVVPPDRAGPLPAARTGAPRRVHGRAHRVDVLRQRVAGAGATRPARLARRRGPVPAARARMGLGAVPLRAVQGRRGRGGCRAWRGPGRRRTALVDGADAGPGGEPAPGPHPRCQRLLRRPGGRGNAGTPTPKLVRWLAERECASATGATGPFPSSTVRPDGWGVWREGTERVEFFLEYDRGSEPLPRLRGKPIAVWPRGCCSPSSRPAARPPPGEP